MMQVLIDGFIDPNYLLSVKAAEAETRRARRCSVELHSMRLFHSTGCENKLVVEVGNDASFD